MPRPKKVDRPVEKTINLPASIVAKVELELFSELEGRVPFGAWQTFIVGLVEEYFQRKTKQVAGTVSQEEHQAAIASAVSRP